MDTTKNIYNSLWTMSAPFVLPGEWDAIPCHSSFRQLDAQALKQVLDYFRPEELAAAGLYHRQDKEWCLTAALKKMPATLLFARGPGEVGLQVIAGMRGLGAHIGALPAWLQDAEFGSLFDDWDHGPILTTSMRDLAIYTSLGVPALPASGFARMNESRLKIILQLWAARFGDEWPACFILPAARLHDLRLHRCPYLQQVSTHLSRVERLLNVGCEFRWWTPTPATLDDLAFLTEYSGKEQLRHAIANSLAGREHDVPLLEWTAEPQDLPSALSRWQQALCYGEMHSEPWSAVLQQLQRQLVDPLLQEALNSKPCDRIRLAALAALLPGTLGRLIQFGQDLRARVMQGSPIARGAMEKDLQRALDLLKSFRELTGGVHARSR